MKKFTKSILTALSLARSSASSRLNRSRYGIKDY